MSYTFKITTVNHGYVSTWSMYHTEALIGPKRHTTEETSNDPRASQSEASTSPCSGQSCGGGGGMRADQEAPLFTALLIIIRGERSQLEDWMSSSHRTRDSNSCKQYSTDQLWYFRISCCMCHNDALNLHEWMTVVTCADDGRTVNTMPILLVGANFFTI